MITTSAAFINTKLMFLALKSPLGLNVMPDCLLSLVVGPSKYQVHSIDK
jgi:hypothetical protein